MILAFVCLLDVLILLFVLNVSTQTCSCSEFTEASFLLDVLIPVLVLDVIMLVHVLDELILVVLLDALTLVLFLDY